MNRTLTITLSINDHPDILPYALEIAKESIGYTFIAAEFEKAELDGVLLLSKDGEAPQEVKQLKQYTHITDKLSCRH